MAKKKDYSIGIDTASFPTSGFSAMTISFQCTCGKFLFIPSEHLPLFKKGIHKEVKCDCGITYFLKYDDKQDTITKSKENK